MRAQPREPDIEAVVSYLPTEQGGRRQPAFSGYRPNHRILEDYITSGDHEYLESIR